MTDDLAATGRAQGFSMADSWETLRLACATANLDTTDARMMRFGENALFHLPAVDAVVRIARTMDYWDDAVKEVNVARWLVDHHFPAAEAYDVAQPVEAAERPVTFWLFIHGRPGDERDIGTLGAVLRRLHHTLPPTTFVLPPEDILGRVAPRILSAPIPSADKDFLSGLLHDLGEKVSTLDYPLAPAPTHGDAHSENLMIRRTAAIVCTVCSSGRVVCASHAGAVEVDPAERSIRRRLLAWSP